jgi:tRNA(adenine34) deaminase
MARKDFEHWMSIALEEAEAAASEGEVPIGAVIVLEGKLLARERNRSIQRSDPTAHAEILALRAGAKRISNYRLEGAEVFSTIEPCPMCAGALIWARAARLVFGARDEKGGGVVSKFQILEPGKLNHCVEVIEGPGADRAREMLQSFFRKRRQRE